MRQKENRLNWFALSQGREVFALPGKVDSGTSFGTNGLIKQGAKLVSCLEDITEELQASAQEKPAINRMSNKQAAGLSLEDFPYLLKNLTGEEAALYNIISAQPIGLDDIVDKAKMEVTKIAALLLRLQMRRLIKELPGKQFVKY